MSEVVGEGVVRIRTDESGVDVDGAGKRAGQGYTSGFKSSLKGLAVAIGATLAATKAVDFLKDSVAEGREAQKVAAATTQIIKATGGAANITAGQVSDLAGALSLKTGVDDEAIQTGANLLLTFKNVRNEVGKGNDIFNQATQASLDLSAAGFGSVESASKGLGKALNDPLKGITALGRAGVTFTEAQKSQIAAMVEQGDLLGAQKIILGEVQAQVGGVAEATATAGEKASVAWGNVKEQVGTALIPVLDTLANIFVTHIVPAILGVVDAASGLGPVFRAVGGFIQGAFSGDEAGSFFDSIRTAVSSVMPVLMGLFQQALPVLQSFFAGLAAQAQATLPVLRDLFVGQVLPAVTALAEYVIANVVPIFLQVADIVATQVVPAIGALAQFVYGTLYPALLSIVTAVASNLKPVLDTLVAVFRDQILPTVARVIEQIRTELIPALQPIISVVVTVVGALLQFASAVLGVVLPPLIRLAAFIIANVIPAVVKIITVVLQVIGFLGRLAGAVAGGIASFGRFQAAAASLVREGIEKVLSVIASLPTRIINLGGKFLEAGESIIGKFVDGLKGVGSFASGIADAIWGAVKGVINSAIDKLNDLLEFTIDVGPKSFTVNPPDIGHLQGGTQSARAGFYTVGEVGPERVYLPEGARVLTAAQTRQEVAGGDVVALLAAILAALQAGAQRPNVTAVLPDGDPEAAAMAIFNRFATAGEF